MKQLLFLGIGLSFLVSCGQNPTPVAVNPHVKFAGRTMGTVYNVTYTDSLGRNLQPQLDSLLNAFNQQLSTYDNSSTITLVNNSPSVVLPKNKADHLVRNILIAKEIYQKTDGWFNPAVKPLVNYWGFGYKEKRPIAEVDSAKVDSLRALCDFEGVAVEDAGADSVRISKRNPLIQIEFNAMAPGEAADLLGTYLEAQGIRNYLIEIGGELRARGQKPKGGGWNIGINTPQDNVETDDFKAVITLNNKSLATSGNYRAFYESGGKRYVHTINPKTGYTEQNNLLSATVVTESSAHADAYATAFMAMGYERAWALAPTLAGVEVYFIWVDKNGQVQESSTPNVGLVK